MGTLNRRRHHLRTRQIQEESDKVQAAGSASQVGVGVGRRVPLIISPVQTEWRAVSILEVEMVHRVRGSTSKGVKVADALGDGRKLSS